MSFAQVRKKARNQSPKAVDLMSVLDTTFNVDQDGKRSQMYAFEISLRKQVKRDY
jgi:hypothetical protein